MLGIELRFLIQIWFDLWLKWSIFRSWACKLQKVWHFSFKSLGEYLKLITQYIYKGIISLVIAWGNFFGYSDLFRHMIIIVALWRLALTGWLILVYLFSLNRWKCCGLDKAGISLVLMTLPSGRGLGKWSSQAYLLWKAFPFSLVTTRMKSHASLSSWANYLRITCDSVIITEACMSWRWIRTECRIIYSC